MLFSVQLFENVPLSHDTVMQLQQQQHCVQNDMRLVVRHFLALAE